jgi:cytochrome o ubiquinol oxidase subunit 2
MCRSVFWASPAIAVILLDGCSGGVLDAAGPVAAADRAILLDALALMLAFVVPIVAATLGLAWWFRASNAQAVRLPTFAYSGRLEFLIWAIPALIVMFLGGIAWIGSQQLDPFKRIDSPNAAIEVQAVSMDWKWLFIYPDQHIASVNALTIPVGTPVHFRLTSATVMNSFFIPQLGSQIYTMAGMTSQLNLMAERAGDFRGISAQFSGAGFPDMHFAVHAVPAPGFDDWVRQTRAQASTLDSAAYTELLQAHQDINVRNFGQVDPQLFDSIVR